MAVRVTYWIRRLRTGQLPRNNAKIIVTHNAYMLLVILLLLTNLLIVFSR